MFGIRAGLLALRRVVTTPLSWYGTGLATAFAALYFALGSASDTTLSNIWFTADTLFPCHVGRDVIIDGQPASGWTYPVATFIFPDVVFASLCSIAIPHPALATFAYGILQVTFVVTGLLLCCRSLELRRPQLAYGGVILGAITVTLLCALGASTQAPRLIASFKQSNHFDFVTIQNLFLAQLHTGCFAVAMWCAGLGLLLMKTDSWRWARCCGALALTLLCALGCMGDLLFLVQFTVAFVCAAVVAVYVNWISWRRVALPVCCSGVGSWIGLRLEKVLFVAKAADDMGAFTLNSAMKALDAYVHGIRDTHWTKYNWLQVSASVWLAACVVLVLLAIRRQLTRPAADTNTDSPQLTPLFFSFLGLSGLGSAAAIIAGGHFYLALYRDFTQAMKYQHTLFLLPFFGWGLLLSMVLAFCVRSERWVNGLLWAGALVALGMPLWFLGSYAKKAQQPLHTYRPVWVRELDRHAVEHDLHAGVADFWAARPVTLFSQQHLKAVHVSSDFRPGLGNRLHLANKAWYTDPCFDFLILTFNTDNGPKDATKICWAFGHPAAILHLDNYRQLWVYNRPSDVIFREHFFNPLAHTPVGSRITLGGAALPAETGIVENTLRVARPGAKAGLFTHGPGLRLPPGRYRVTMSLTAEALGGSKVGYWEAGCFQDGPAITGGSGPIYPGKNTVEANLTVPADQLRTLEVRTFYEGIGTMFVHEMTIERIE